MQCNVIQDYAMSSSSNLCSYNAAIKQISGHLYKQIFYKVLYISRQLLQLFERSFTSRHENVKSNEVQGKIKSYHDE